MRKYPALVSKLGECADAWLVGSAVLNEVPRDYDVIIPFSHWVQAAMVIPENAVPNTFGGWKCISENKEIDVWPAELTTIVLSEKFIAAKHIRSGKTIIVK